MNFNSSNSGFITNMEKKFLRKKRILRFLLKHQAFKPRSAVQCTFLTAGFQPLFYCFIPISSSIPISRYLASVLVHIFSFWTANLNNIMQVCVRIFGFSIQLNVKILLQTSVVINKLNVSFYHLINLILIPSCLTYPSCLFSLVWLLFDDCCYVDVLKNTTCLTTVSIFFYLSIEYHSIWMSGVKFRKFILKCLHVYFRIIF